MTDPRLVQDIQAAESCRLSAYKDTTGHWTIGWGHLLEASDASGLQWTQETADSTLESDINAAMDEASKLPEWAALDTPCRQNALTELVFNMGVKTWSEFLATRHAMINKWWQTVHDHLLASEWEREVHEGRADRIANYFLTGQYPEVST